MRNESRLQVQLKKLEQEICLGNQQTFAKYPTCPQDWINPDCSVTQINQSPYTEDVWLSNQSFYYWVTQFSLWTGEEWCDLCTSCPESTERRNLRTRASWFHPQHWVSECGWLLSVIKSGWDPAGIWVRRWQQKGEDSKHVQADRKTLLCWPSAGSSPGMQWPELPAADTERLLSWPRKDLSLLSHSNTGYNLSTGTRVKYICTHLGLERVRHRWP